MLVSAIKVILKILPLISALFGLFFLTQQIFPDFEKSHGQNCSVQL